MYDSLYTLDFIRI